MAPRQVLAQREIRDRDPAQVAPQSDPRARLVRCRDRYVAANDRGPRDANGTREDSRAGTARRSRSSPRNDLTSYVRGARMPRLRRNSLSSELVLAQIDRFPVRQQQLGAEIACARPKAPSRNCRRSAWTTLTRSRLTTSSIESMNDFAPGAGHR